MMRFLDSENQHDQLKTCKVVVLKLEVRQKRKLAYFYWNGP
jgi:hypothetical protein